MVLKMLLMGTGDLIFYRQILRNIKYWAKVLKKKNKPTSGKVLALAPP